MATQLKAEPAKTKVKWTIEADFLQACNCDYGCPCEFEAPPTNGYCEGIGAWRINKGNYGTVKLDGLGLGFAARWPEAIHKGNGTGCIFVDEKATPEQREALFTIASGQAGGMPFEIIAQTFSKVLDTQYVPFTFNVEGRNSSASLGKAVTMQLEPIKNPVTGEPEGLRVEHETGFMFKSAECVSARSWKASVGELNFSGQGNAGFVSRIKYSN